ncbi:MAG: YbaB/EbfC family nucleoid-associated protein [Acidobacteria bacterium]|nr:MAG: YbaB/EbfC family nucleoid-associated protein [Acidobacteriota bacterium]
MLKQAQEMQKKLQQEVEEMTVESSAGGGMVNITMRGNKELLSVKIDPEAVDPDDVEMLQDLIIAAVNEASRKVDEAVQEQMGNMTGGMGFPGVG